MLEGSVRKAADRLRITGQLVEAETGHHVWADRFEGRIEDIFDLQDRITASVVAAIEPNVLLAELQRSRSKPTQSLTAYDLYLRSLPLTHQNSQDTLSEATDLLRRALALDSSYSDAWAGLADCVARQTFNGFIESWESGGQAACEAALKAVEADPENGRAVSVRAWNLSAFAGKNDEASELAARALRLHPNSAYVQTNCGWTFAYDGDTERALACFDAARRMSPLDPRGYLTFNGLAMAHLLSGNFAEVDRWTARALDQRRAVPATLRIRAAALAHLGCDDDARDLVRELLAIQPNATIDRAARLGVRDERQRAIFLEGLRLAGLPE